LLTTFAGAGTFDVLLEETGANPNSGPAPVDYQSLALVLSSNPADSPGINELVQLGEDGVLRRAPEGATARLIGVCQANCGGSGPARIVTRGMASCVFDGPAEAGHYVQISASSAGQCHDAGASRPASGQVLGFVFGSVAASGPAPVLFEPDVR
jgi:hypothetical protein